MKLNTLLAKTDFLRSKFKNMISDYSQFFSKSQGSFLGEKGTYIPREGCLDELSKKKYVKVSTTVDEKFDYFIKENKEFIDALFSQEKTNALGLAKAKLVIDGDNWGEFTSLELLRLKSLLESKDMGNFEDMLSKIPVRSDAEIWSESSVEEYKGRNIWESPKLEGVSHSSVKEEYILEDPNVHKAGNNINYSPKTAVRTTIIDVGDYTYQVFSGAWSHRQRAGALKRRSDLLAAVIVALKECNDVESVSSELTAEKIFNFLFKE